MLAKLKRLYRDPVLLVQSIKVGLLLILVIAAFFIFPTANARKPSARERAAKPAAAEPVAADTPLSSPTGYQANPNPPVGTVTEMAMSPSDEKKTKKSKKKKKGKDVEEIDHKNYLTREDGRQLKHINFEVPAGLRVPVEFWKMIYSKYGRAQEVFHDTEDLSIVYSVLDFSDLYNNAGMSDETRRAIRRERVRDEKDRIKSLLLGLDDLPLNPRPLSPEEQKIADMFKDDPNPQKFKDAASDDRLRSQTGIRDNFIEGIKNSGAFMEEIEDIFNSYGMPVELTRIVFVESMFNLKARSKVGASGLWQFMPGTGKLYLSIDSITDERNDPLEASHAAAKLLSSNYEALGSWPLAINAYNSGRATMSRAVSDLGTTDIATIVRYYRGGVYGFASRNFFPSFLAALEVANHYPKYFGELRRQGKQNCEYYYLKNPQYFGSLASSAGLELSQLMFLNSHLNEDVLNDRRKLPAGYRIRIPAGTAPQCARADSGSSADMGIASDGTPGLAR